ncbi:MAG: hypothetical protein FWD68_14035 [Alphaproteobacteria bacterium]|nr:hypothetical protein [Alphaproteobacteria bacterium]
MVTEPIVDMNVQTLIEIRNDIKALKTGMDGLETRMETGFRDVNDRIALLRRDVVEYHYEVLGQRGLIVDLNNRVARIERGEENAG